MFTWHRVFGSLEKEPPPAELCEELLRHGFAVRPHFRGDERGWFAARLEWEDGSSSLNVGRFLVQDDNLRGDLNSWCAWVETLPESAAHEVLLDTFVCTKQLFTFYADAEPEGEAASPGCLILCRWLAQQTQGIYQIDGQGVYDKLGTLLVADTACRAHA